MTAPIEIDVPHKLGAAEVRRRMESGLDTLAGFVPGGIVTERRWVDDTLHVAIEALGQRVTATMQPFDDRVHAEFLLPPMLQLFAGKIRDKLKRDGGKLLG